MKRIILLICVICCAGNVFAQTVRGKIFDAISREPIPGATITDTTGTSVTSGSDGGFKINTKNQTLKVSFIGYQTRRIPVTGTMLAIALQPSKNQLNQVVVSANRTAEKRSEAPVAISTISGKVMQDTKAQRLDYLLNKVSGVNMASLGNEYNQIAIRQPVGPNNRFLFLEDGLPIRTFGVFDHNGLLEMNATAAKEIEVIKGPSSALYGAEAIGGAVNVITLAPPVYTSGYASVQSSNRGYRRVDGQVGSTSGKVGFLLSGYYANQKDGPIQYSDFHKTAITARLDYHIDSATTWTNSATYTNFFSDMYGNLDSAHFAQHNYLTNTLFTYRKSNAFRLRSTISHKWSENGSTNATFLYRDNSVTQNPSYAISTYRTGGKATNPVSPDTAGGNINTNAFKSYGLYLQHVQRFKFLDSKLIIGTSGEVSPQSFYQDFIWVKKQTQNGITNYVSFTNPNPEIVMANYKTVISNFGSYGSYDFKIAEGLRVSAALRYDAFQYAFVNALPGSPVTGGPSQIVNYGKVAPKIGFTYNHNGIGFYGTYSEGYVPPQLTDVFGIASNNAYLLPQTFKNYELGGWLSLLQNKLYIDYSFYLMNGTNEIITVQQANNTYASQNAGATRHKGVEYGLTYRPTDDLYLRLSGTNALHTFVNYVESGINYSGYEMQTAPHFIGNAEVMYKPHYIKGFRIGLEEQKVGKYYLDNLQRYTYGGYSVTNIRTGYLWGPAEIWINALNVFNKYYATKGAKSAYGYSYSLGDPRAFTLGLAYHFGR
ncbi:TonB-dependent receptor [Mucilaginibacter paludis]|uniref:TonB-dependent receptor plug n=1 Tax=Mucilaginibacter paludis DSM 18603 TaxID=714943 RepID=H1Y842_9SPHI|nr:TonB-dependent receptor [Mucilaginibacter paludis]EHQ31064.1 TonB-dependent receptor plug [Mucilaginibacter paludis DSM 18603]